MAVCFRSVFDLRTASLDHSATRSNVCPNKSTVCLVFAFVFCLLRVSCPIDSKEKLSPWIRIWRRNSRTEIFWLLGYRINDRYESRNGAGIDQRDTLGTPIILVLLLTHTRTHIYTQACTHTHTRTHMHTRARSHNNDQLQHAIASVIRSSAPRQLNTVEWV